MQIERLEIARVFLTDREKEIYWAAPDVWEKGDSVGYKRCGKCRELKKFYLFNKNSAARNGCSGNCKECQKATAAKSYDKNKSNRDYKALYQKNAESKRAAGRKYYQENREAMRKKHAQYRTSDTGKAVMQKAHAKRRDLINENSGIRYTREMVIARDNLTGHPECILCGEVINDGTLHLEHLIPISMGGLDCFTNVACAHAQCNLVKTKKATEVTTEQVETVKNRAEEFMNKYPERFPEFFSVD